MLGIVFLLEKKRLIKLHEMSISVHGAIYFKAFFIAKTIRDYYMSLVEFTTWHCVRFQCPFLVVKSFTYFILTNAQNVYLQLLYNDSVENIPEHFGAFSRVFFNFFQIILSFFGLTIYYYLSTYYILL